jgi:hypothetical protein
VVVGFNGVGEATSSRCPPLKESERNLELDVRSGLTDTLVAGAAKGTWISAYYPYSVRLLGAYWGIITDDSLELVTADH